ncbi:hypothetical protein BOTBODRAFT_170241 [Botryobasidium botryosum FD-172 SS1]|uniref:Cytochrome P450 n=1 Tax=Botryobasidium botryosum (strain FD-172 SS1) TaxID=930990 RepID=A0A067MZX3_BOTB1|nr:hypothetical protein BOTBODRAFT_170241 [Botryobasidium botryosum FD-172 SS1]
MFKFLAAVPQLWLRVLIEVGISFAAVFLVRLLSRKIRFRHALGHLPGPEPPSWLWGSEWDVYVSEPGKIYLDWAEKYGRVYKFRGALRSMMLTITDPRAVSYVLGAEHAYDYPKPKGARAWFKLLVIKSPLYKLGEGVLYAEGEEHAHHRRTLSPAFNLQATRNLCSIFVDCASKAVEKWTEELDKSPEASLEFDVQYWANRISLDTFGLAGFSHDFDTLSNKKPTGLAAVLDSLTDSNASFSSFVLHALLFTFPSILKAPGRRRKMLGRAREAMSEITTRVWANAKQRGEDDGGKTILEILVDADSENELTEDAIAAEMMTLIFAGYETTSCVISWTLHELSLDPSLQARLREEVSANPSDPSFDDLYEDDKLPLLDAVVQETIRLHPPILELHRVAAQSGTIPLSTPLPGTPGQPASDRLFVPRGTLIAIPLNVMQREKSVWGDDADKFRPERWIEYNNQREREKASGKTHLGAERRLMAFSEGKRVCIGKTFALVEIKAVLVILLRHFTFTKARDIEDFVSFVVRPRVKGEKKSTLPIRVGKVV